MLYFEIGYHVASVYMKFISPIFMIYGEETEQVPSA